MTERDDPVEARPPRPTHVIYNATLGHLRVKAEEGLATTIEIPAGDVRFRRIPGAVEPEAALWLNTLEREYLGRMLEHVLGALTITPEARTSLEAVRTKLAELAPPSIVTSDPEEVRREVSPPLSVPPASGADARESVAAEESGGPSVGTDSSRPRVRARNSKRSPGQRTREHQSDAPARRGAAPAMGPATAERLAAEPASGEPQAPAGTPSPAGQAPMQPAGPIGAETDTPSSFDAVWCALEELASLGPELQPLAGQSSSEIREVTGEGIWLYSQAIGREYLVRRDRLEAAWDALARDGYLVPRDVGMSYGAVTLLAHLPYVEYSTQPVMLYYPAGTRHALGTVVHRGSPD